GICWFAALREGSSDAEPGRKWARGNTESLRIEAAENNLSGCLPRLRACVEYAALASGAPIPGSLFNSLELNKPFVWVPVIHRRMRVARRSVRVGFTSIS